MLDAFLGSAKVQEGWDVIVLDELFLEPIDDFPIHAARHRADRRGVGDRDRLAAATGQRLPAPVGAVAEFLDCLLDTHAGFGGDELGIRGRVEGLGHGRLGEAAVVGDVENAGSVCG